MYEIPLLFAVYVSLNGFQTSSGVLENDFSGAGWMFYSQRNAIDARFFDAQLTCYANFEEACKDLRQVQEIESIKAVNKKASTHFCFG